MPKKHLAKKQMRQNPHSKVANRDISIGKPQVAEDKALNRIDAYYAEAGEMLRHYSTTRTAVLSISLPTCLGILGWVLAAGRLTKLELYLLAAEAVVFLYGLILSLFFSTKYEQARRVLVKLEAGDMVSVYTSIVGSRPRERIQADSIDKSIIALGIFAHCLFYAYFLLL